MYKLNKSVPMGRKKKKFRLIFQKIWYMDSFIGCISLLVHESIHFRTMNYGKLTEWWEVEWLSGLILTRTLRRITRLEFICWFTILSLLSWMGGLHSPSSRSPSFLSRWGGNSCNITDLQMITSNLPAITHKTLPYCLTDKTIYL